MVNMVISHHAGNADNIIIRFCGHRVRRHKRRNLLMVLRQNEIRASDHAYHFPSETTGNPWWPVFAMRANASATVAFGCKGITGAEMYSLTLTNSISASQNLQVGSSSLSSVPPNDSR